MFHAALHQVMVTKCNIATSDDGLPQHARDVIRLLEDFAVIRTDGLYTVSGILNFVFSNNMFSVHFLYKLSSALDRNQIAVDRVQCNNIFFLVLS